MNIAGAELPAFEQQSIAENPQSNLSSPMPPPRRKDKKRNVLEANPFPRYDKYQQWHGRKLTSWGGGAATRKAEKTGLNVQFAAVTTAQESYSKEVISV